MDNYTDFFLGTNTPYGFFSLFDELYNPYGGWRTYIFKGGPGTGKSGMMKCIFRECEKRGIEAERIRCASDPKSLDALIFNDIKVCVVDGTAPHIVEPRFPGAVENIINLGEFWDGDILYAQREDIIRLTSDISSQHRKCIRFLEAAGSIERDIRRIARLNTDVEKTERYASRLAARKLGTPRGRIGEEKKRLLSAITPDGIISLDDTVRRLCGDVLIIEDDYGAVSQLLIGLLRGYAIGNGYDVISCPCPMKPREGPEYLLIPDIGFAALTSNSAHCFDIEGATRVRASRFMDNQGLKEHKCRLGFSKRTRTELIDEAIVSVKRALELHDLLEHIYASAMNFDGIDAAAASLTEKILGIAEECDCN